MQPFSFIGTGTYVNAASALPTTVALSDKPDYFMVRDITNYGAASNAAGLIEAWTYPNTMAAGSYRGTGMTNAAATSNTFYGLTGTTNGFTFINSASPPTFTALAATAINTTTWVISMASTAGLAVGDIVRVTVATGCVEIGGYTGQITALTANVSITLGYIATAVTAGGTYSTNATTSSIRKIIPSLFSPSNKRVMYISQATQAKVYFASPNPYSPGEALDFSIPTQYGMIEMSYLTGKSRGPARVLVVTNTASESSVTLDLDTTGFTPFTLPVTATFKSGNSPAICVPAGSLVVPLNGSATVPQSPPGTNLLDAFDNLNQYYMYIGSSVVGANSATMQWTAWKADYGNLSNA